MTKKTALVGLLLVLLLAVSRQTNPNPPGCDNPARLRGPESLGDL